MKYTNTTSSNELQIRTYNRILHIIASQNGPDAATQRAQLYGLEACLEDPDGFFKRAKSVCTEQNWDEFRTPCSLDCHPKPARGQDSGPGKPA